MDWEVEAFSKWVDRHKQCVEFSGDYLEKVRRSLDIGCLGDVIIDVPLGKRYLLNCNILGLYY